jgi:hypothetical protein
MYRFQVRLKHIKKKLKQWTQEVFKNIDQENKDIEEKMDRIQKICIQEGYNMERKNEESHLHQEWEKICKQEEILWRQKSRVQWLKEGEKNTKFFHRSRISRRTQNRILKI